MSDIIISADELSAMLRDENTTPEMLARYFEVDELRSTAFDVKMKLRPEVVVTYRPGQVEVEQFGGTIMDGANGFMRWRRKMRYRSRIHDNPSIVRFVAEGDSWFQHPLITETIDHLIERHGRAICSLDAAGATLEAMMDEDEYITAIQEEGASALLLSGGGNDLMGDHFGSYLNQYTNGVPGENAARLLNAALDVDMERLFGHYKKILTRVKNETPGVKVFTHTYDYVKPRSGSKGKWLGRPMEAHGITDQRDKEAIIVELINRFAEGVGKVCQQFPGIAFQVRSIGCVPGGQWDDEIHPTDSGFRPVADMFQATLQAQGL